LGTECFAVRRWGLEGPSQRQPLSTPFYLTQYPLIIKIFKSFVSERKKDPRQRDGMRYWGLFSIGLLKPNEINSRWTEVQSLRDKKASIEDIYLLGWI
jgi:hypothetical protein